MKKMNALLSALSLAVAALTPITSSAGFADNRDTMEVSKEYASSYTITIPDSTQQLEQNQKFEVEATAFLNFGEKLTVSVASKNGWNLVDKVHTENTDKVPYKMSINGANITETTAEILEVPYDIKNGAVTLTVAELENSAYAGTYSDTLTFTATVSEVTKSGGESGETT